MNTQTGHDIAAAGGAPAGSAPEPWRPIVVDVPGPEFEPEPPGQFSFDFPDTECEGWSTAALTLRYASVRGARHRFYRQPRQDAARAAVHETTGSIVFAVADGVSSASHAELGAVEACRAAVERLLQQLSASAGPVDFRDVAQAAAQRLHERAQWRLGLADPEPSEVAALYATTLVAGVVRPGPGGSAEGSTVELGRVGDSGAWLLSPLPLSPPSSHGAYQELFTSKTGADTLFVSNAVAPLPQVPEQLQTTGGPLAAGQVLLIGTDGFGDPLGDGDGYVGALFAQHLATPPPALWFGHLLDFSRETFDDDRTLLAVWPRRTGGPR